MKQLLILFLILIVTTISFAQTELKATMGINFFNFPSAQDYINQIYAPDDDQLGTFNTAAIFTFEAGYFLTETFEMSIELPYQIYSYNTNISGSGQYDLYYDSFLPSVMAYYVIMSTSYNFKFGGGLGPSFVTVTEEKKWQGTSDDYSSTGFGTLVRVEGNTGLAENVFVNIGFDIRYDFNGEPENDNGNKLVNNVEEENVNFNSLGFSIKLGISYLIH